MQKKDWQITAILVVVVIGLIGMFAGWGPSAETPQVIYPTADAIATITAALIVLPDTSSQDNEKISEIHDKFFEDDAWEDKAELLATEEWEENDWKDLYKAISDIYGDLDDEDDIEYVREDESTEFSSMDADDEDGVVTQFLKIKYEDEDGDDRKVYLTVETEFDEGDLEDQEIYESE